jgi:hypothetical protein
MPVEVVEGEEAVDVVVRLVEIVVDILTVSRFEISVYRSIVKE